MAPKQVENVNHGLIIGNEPYLGDDSDELIEFGVVAEEAGWDGVFLGDHICPHEYSGEYQAGFDPWITLAGIATRTDRIKLGTWVTPLPRRQPWQVARDLATLDRLSDGRVILGSGLGEPPAYTTFGQPYELAEMDQKYDEALDVVTGLWRGEQFSYDGEYYTIDEAVVLPTPVQEPRIPVVLGCWWPNKKPFQRGARWDGVMPNWPTMSPSESGPHGEDATGSLEEEVRTMLEYYHELTDDPGKIFMPIDPPRASQAYVDTCKELDVTWFLTTHIDRGPNYTLDVERIRDGPPE